MGVKTIRFHTAASVGDEPGVVKLASTATMLDLKKAIASEMGVDFIPDASLGGDEENSEEEKTADDDSGGGGGAGDEKSAVEEVVVWIQVPSAVVRVVLPSATMTVAELKQHLKRQLSAEASPAAAASDHGEPFFFACGGAVLRHGRQFTWRSSSSSSSSSPSYEGPGTDPGRPSWRTATATSTRGRSISGMWCWTRPAWTRRVCSGTSPSRCSCPTPHRQ